ncbi:hypothetical protein ACVWYF_003654 [Hymenobacter sp. UYAg731]
MWSDNDIDKAFQRLNPPEPEPTPFPLDAWLRLENQLDKAVIERAVRRRLWQFFAAEVAVVLLIGLGWLVLRPTAPAPIMATATLAGRPAVSAIAAAPAAGHQTTATARRPAPTAANTPRAAASDTPLTAAPASAAPAAATRPSQASSAASPTPAAAASKASAIPHPTIAHPFTVTPTPALASHRRTRDANTEAAVRQQGIANGLVAATETGKAVRRFSEGAAATNRYATVTTPSERVAKTYSETSKRPKSRTSRLHSVAPGAGYAGAAHTRNPVATHPWNARMASVTTTATDGSATPPTSAEAILTAAGFVPLAPAAVPAPAAEPVPLPMPLATVALAETLPQAEVATPAHEPRFYVALVGAPDVSTVKFASIEKPMANVGLVLEYRLSRRLRVNTGLLRATKQYVARRADYDFGAYAPNIVHRYFDDVDGSCTVLDVPLNLRYDLLTRPRYRLYGSAGLSSFFMQREQYSYAYTENYRAGYWQGDFVNANRHYLSILNLAAGYERTLSAHWSLQAEPYLKLPLAGVGAGKIQLTSAGVFLGVKYGF